MGYFEVIIFSQTSGVRIFFPLIRRCKIFFSALCVMSNIFFSAGYCVSQEFLCMLVLSRNQSAGYFFSEITYKPLKTQIVGPQDPPNICSVEVLICNHF